MSGELPNVQGTATVKPIFKKGNQLDTGNFRPISLTSLICKLMESIVSHFVMKFLFDHNIIPAEEHGFVPSRSVYQSSLLPQ